MSRIITEAEIAELLAEEKRLPANYRSMLEMKLRDAHYRSELMVPGEKGSEFWILMRKLEENNLDFSVILAAKASGHSGYFRLRRYNGKSHSHKNSLENEMLSYSYHIHFATERYQSASRKEDGYAVTTDKYTSIIEALEVMVSECGFIEPNEDSGLFSDQGVES